MLSFICGEVVDVTENFVVLKNGGIGYQLNVSTSTLKNCVVGQSIQLFCHLQVKEDGLSLFGFSTMEEKSMFLRLLTVKNIGCKSAQAILSGINARDLAFAIMNGDSKALTKIKGLGKKTAELVILELREKVGEYSFDQVSLQSQSHVFLSKEMQDAVSILMSLGLSRQEAERRVISAAETDAKTTEQLLNVAFKIG